MDGFPSPDTMISDPVHKGAGVDTTTFCELVRQAWSPFTSAYMTCTNANIAWGQSDVSALAVQDALGGKIVRTEFTLPDGHTGPHYLNLLPDGSTVDVSQDQYPEGTTFNPAPGSSAEQLEASGEAYLASQHFHGNMRDYLLSETLAEQNSQRDAPMYKILTYQPATERYEILQHNIAAAQKQQIRRA